MWWLSQLRYQVFYGTVKYGQRLVMVLTAIHPMPCNCTWIREGRIMGSTFLSHAVRMWYGFCLPSFHGVGKRAACAVWTSMPNVTEIFARLSRPQSQVFRHDLKQIERYAVLLYQRTSTHNHVNEARKQLFTHNRSMENILQLLMPWNNMWKWQFFEHGTSGDSQL